MPKLTPIDGFINPLGGQQIELQHLDHDAGGMSLLRLRIRERSRFTVFEMDPLTARRWAESMLAWAQAQPLSSAEASATGPSHD